jgi:Pin2-interacting protein X1
MTSQGWTPGSFLGARNASHADTFTNASASHIRVTMKDDTLGLGARAPKMGNENVAALDAFQGLLGRLNGKSDTQLEEEQRKRDDTRLALYARSKWQTVTFVSGGYLVQEKPDAAKDKAKKNTSEMSDDTTAEDESVKSSDDNTSNKDTQAEDQEPSLEDEAKKLNSKDVDGKDTKDKKKRKRKEKEAKEEKKSKKEKKEKREKKEKTEKKEKKERKEKKREKDSKKRRRTDADEDNSDSSTATQPDSEAVSKKVTSLQRQIPHWRHSLRGRHIQQKKMAVMDERSLGEVSLRQTIQYRLCPHANLNLDFHD